MVIPLVVDNLPEWMVAADGIVYVYHIIDCCHL